MGKNKVTLLLAAVLLLLTPCPQAYSWDGAFSWERVGMNAHRSAVALSPSAKKEKALLDACLPAMAHLKTVLGKTSAAMDLYRPESPLSNWVVDAMMEQTSIATGIKCEAGVLNFGGIRTFLPKGDIIDDDISSMFPFHNNVYVVMVRGDKLMSLLTSMYQHQWEVLGGIRVKASPQGLESVSVAGEPLDSARLYSVVTNSFLYTGGDGICLKDLSEKCVDSGVSVYSMMRAYLERTSAKGRLVEGSVDGRIQLVGYSVAGDVHSGASSGTEPERFPGQSDGAVLTDISSKRRCLTIIHTNDTHSHMESMRAGRYTGMGGVVERAAFIDSVRRSDGPQNVLVLDAGDYSQGTPYFSIFNGMVEVKAMNIMGYDVSTIGNHEWDNGFDQLKERFAKASFKTVLCNYDFDDRSMYKYVKPYVIVRRGGLKIGITGVLGDITEVVDKSYVEKLHYLAPAESINNWADWLKNEKKCDLVIVLSHCGFQGRYNDLGDIQFARSLRNVDIIIGGHTHTNLKEPVYIDDSDGKPVMIVTDYCWGLYAGVLKCYR